MQHHRRTRLYDLRAQEGHAHRRRHHQLSARHLTCHLIALNVSWNTLKEETAAHTQDASVALSSALSSLPSLTALSSSGNRFALEGKRGVHALGVGAYKGELHTLHTQDTGGRKEEGTNELDTRQASWGGMTLGAMEEVN